MSSVGSVRFTGLFPDTDKHITVCGFMSNIKKGAEAPLVQLITTRLSARRSEDAQWITYAEWIALTSLVTAVASVEVAVHRSSHWATNEVLQTVRYVSSKEPVICISQIVIDSVSAGYNTVALNGVEIVISSTYATFSFQQTGSNELQVWWDD